MRKNFTLTLAGIIFTGIISNAQIGVNTNKPTANLDINGTLRVRSLEKKTDGFQATGQVLYIMGVDAEGNVIPIEIGDNIILQNNKLVAQLPEEDSTPAELPGGSLEDNYAPGDDALINDLDLGIVLLPGNRRRVGSVIRMDNGTNTDDVQITGFKAAPDGTMAFLYPTSGDLSLVKDSNASEEENRIFDDGSNNDIKIKKDEMMLIMYDGVKKRWMVASKH